MNVTSLIYWTILSAFGGGVGLGLFFWMQAAVMGTLFMGVTP